MKTPSEAEARTLASATDHTDGTNRVRLICVHLCNLWPNRASAGKDSIPARYRSRGGMSLIEVIATIVLSAVLVALILPLIGSGIQGSRRSLVRMPETYSLRSTMDDWWQLYRTTYSDDIPGLHDAIPDGPDVQKTWVTFTATDVEIAGTTSDALRVTLSSAQGERLTTYFFPLP